jgi:hypothetical protein
LRIVIQLPTLPYHHPVFWITLYILSSYIFVGLGIRLFKRWNMVAEHHADRLAMFVTSPITLPVALFIILIVLPIKIFLVGFYHVLTGD